MESLLREKRHMRSYSMGKMIVVCFQSITDARLASRNEFLNSKVGRAQFADEQ